VREAQSIENLFPFSKLVRRNSQTMWQSWPGRTSFSRERFQNFQQHEPPRAKLLDLISFCSHGVFSCFSLIKACPRCTRLDFPLSMRKQSSFGSFNFFFLPCIHVLHDPHATVYGLGTKTLFGQFFVRIGLCINEKYLPN
jgi:hypothetical protein